MMGPHAFHSHKPKIDPQMLHSLSAESRESFPTLMHILEIPKGVRKLNVQLICTDSTNLISSL